MLSNLRSFAQSPYALVIIVLLVLGFALYGVGGIFTGSGTAVVVVGDEQVSTRELAQAHERELRRIQQEDPSFGREEARESGLSERVLQRLIAEAAFTAKAGELGMTVSGDAVVREAARVDAFRNPVTERFDPDTMREALGRGGMTVEQFESDLKTDLLLRQFVASLSSGISVPPILAEIRHQVMQERRRIRAVVIDPSTADAIEDPTEAMLEEFIASNPDARGPAGLPLFTAPEFRRVALVRFRLEDFLRDVDIEEEVLRETYEYQVEAGILGTPSRRGFVQLTAADGETAAAVAERIQAGASPAEAAAEFGLAAPLVQEDVEAYEVPDRELSDVVFAMQEVEVRAVESRFGWSVVQVTMAEDGATPSFEEQRDIILEEIAGAQALDELYDRVAAFEQARAGGASLEIAARESGSPLELFAPMDQYGRFEDLEIDMQRYITLGPDILATAFQQPQGLAIELQQYNETDFFTVRVDDIIPSRPRPLSDVRGQAEARWRAMQIDSQLQARAEEALGELQAGADMEMVALTAGGRAESATLRRGETAASFDEGVVARAFALAEDEWAVTQSRSTGQYVVLAVDEIVPGDVAAAGAGELQTARSEIRDEIVDDILMSAQTALINEYGVNEGAIDRRLVALALGETDPAQQ